MNSPTAASSHLKAARVHAMQASGCGWMMTKTRPKLAFSVRHGLLQKMVGGSSSQQSIKLSYRQARTGLGQRAGPPSERIAGYAYSVAGKELCSTFALWEGILHSIKLTAC